MIPGHEGACEFCGSTEARLEVTMFGDAEPRYTPGYCPCPKPHCVCCNTILRKGRCDHLGCPVYDVLQPLPVIS